MSILGKEACRTGGPGGMIRQRRFSTKTLSSQCTQETDGTESRSASYHHIMRRSM